MWSSKEWRMYIKSNILQEMLISCQFNAYTDLQLLRELAEQ